MGGIDICSFKKLKCWDVAAGILIIQEAGGIVLNSNGKTQSKNILTNIIPFCIKCVYTFLGDQYKDIMNANIIAACTKKLADNFLKLKNNN